jgi:hypothetical protein
VVPVGVGWGAATVAVPAVTAWRVERLPAVVYGPHFLPAAVVVCVRESCSHFIVPADSK